MRLRTLQVAATLFFAGLVAVSPARAQNPETMMPEASEAKARQLIQQMIESLGGPAYLQVRESVCAGRVSQFDHNGAAADPYNFKDYWRYPDNKRTEVSFSGNIRFLAPLMGDAPRKGSHFTQVIAGYKGWTLDLSGVTEVPGESIADFREQVQRDMNNLLRRRLNEKGMIFRYGGSDVVDLHEVDWVEIDDSNQRTFRLAITKNGHLPLRSVVQTPNEADRTVNEEETIYADFHVMEGIQQPMQIERVRDGRPVFQRFIQTCTYNPNLSDDLFTRTSLDQQWAHSGKKNKDTNHNQN